MDSVIVPLDVRALPVGVDDAAHRTAQFAGATTNFTRLGGSPETPNTSENILRPLGMHAADALRRGVHLHWALPEALAHGRSGADGRIVFPPAPNRWLVTRELGGERRQWVVESDRVMTPAEYTAYFEASGRSSTSIPFDDPRVPYRYLGRAFDAATWREDEGAARLARLTAIGPGGAAFAAYYPDCMGVFGFHDPLTDAPAGESSPSYSVIGWYSSAQNDPCTAAVPADWSLKQAPALPARTLCSGVVREVRWNAMRACVAPGRELPSLQAALGNSTTEAFAALLASTWKGPLSPQQVEFLLDAFQLGLLPRSNLAAIEDALHQNAFGAVDGGSLWLVKRREKEQVDDLDSESVTLPGHLAHLLNHLNEEQQRADSRRFELESRRRQVYLDWYRYIHTLYPGPSARADAGAVTDAEALLASELDAIDALSQTRDAELERALERLRSELPEGHEARRAAGPRFWLPNDPVLLLSAEELKPVNRNPEGLTGCRVLSGSPQFTPASAEVEALLAEPWTVDRPGDHRWKPPWLPLLLNWTVGFQPVSRGADGNYEPRHVLDHFGLDEDHIDLQPRALRPAQLGLEESYHGEIPLSTRAAFSLADQVSRVAAERPDLATLSQRVRGMPLLSQCLSGLNLALLGRKLSVQLPPSDRFNGDPDNVTDSRVRNAVMGAGDIAPLGRDGVIGFNPIRAGVLRLTRIEVIDVFGQRAHADSPSVVAAAPLRASSWPGIYLPPRFVQPSRLVLRWLSAAGEVEMNDHPATTPVAGWLVPNHLDDSLSFHTADGLALGTLSLEASQRPVWRPAPDGRPGVVGDPTRELEGRADVSDTLRALISSAWSRPKEFLEDLLTTIETACLNILPGTDAAGLEVLIGRPLALADVSLGLEVQGLPAADSRWPAFERDAAGAQRVYDHSARAQAHFTGVKVAVRLGDPSQSSDGLVGYLPGDGNFYSSAAEPGGLNGVLAPEEAQLQVDAASPPRRVTLLLDPRAAIHATTGVLPVKSIAIPADQYAGALRALEVTFPVNPVLVGREGPALPVPAEAGFAWQWLRPGSEQAALKEHQVDDRASSNYSPQRIQEGWFKLVRTPSK